MKMNWLVALACLLAACAPTVSDTASPPAAVTSGGPTAAAPLTAASTSAEIREAMLASTSRWHSLRMEGTVTWYDPQGGSLQQVVREQVWLEPEAGRFRVVLSGANSEVAETYRASDGTSILELNLLTGQGGNRLLPGFVKETGPARPHQLWGQIGTPLSEIALAANYASEEGAFRPLRTDTVAGRRSLVVEWTPENGTLPQWRLWLDVERAVILRLHEFGKGGGETLQAERNVSAVAYDEVFEDSLFGAPAGIPTFGTGAPDLDTLPSTPSPALTTRNGQLYFFTLPHQQGNSIALVRLPGDCVIGNASCPGLEAVGVPFPFNFSLEPLAWSRDGRLAAFAYSDDPNGTPTKLFTFDPESGAWKALASFPYIDPPFWSPDGTWLAFRVQDGQGGEDIWAVRRDGTGLKNLTTSGRLPAEGRPYVMDGWLTENVIVRSALPGTQGGVFLVRVSDGSVRPLFETVLTKASFIVSPDNGWLAFDEYDYQSQSHALKVIEPDGANPVQVAAFAGGSLYPIVWSPDSTRLAFAHSTTDLTLDPASDVYVIGRDGHGLVQAYHGVTVGRLLFSPDGTHLLVEETTSPTGGHLVTIDLDTLEQRLLAAPGLTLESSWYGPSWRP